MPILKNTSPSDLSYSTARLLPTAFHATAIDYETHQLKCHLQRIALIQTDSPTLLSTAAILENITLALLSLTRLLHIHQILQSAGEPVIVHLEDALSGIARDLRGCEAPGIASRMVDGYTGGPLPPSPREEN